MLLAGLCALLTLGWAVSEELSPGWRSYQREFRRLVDSKLGPEKAADAPRGVQQIWIEPASRVDRCISCHQGVTWAGLEDAPQPHTTHPPEPLVNHPIEKFGCTLCHGGQGSATKLPEAHGWVKHWEEPLLDSQLAADYKIASKAAFLEMKCNACHRYDREVEGMEMLNKAKRLINEKGCRSCHTINARGGTLGPDLTNIGDKHPEQYDYERLTNYASVFNWQVGHLQDPKAFSPDTVMPNFGFKTDEAQALTMLLLSWRKSDVPLELLPIEQLQDVPSAEEAEQERLMREGEGKFFVEKTCNICHDVSSFGIFSATKIGPDLAIAAEDVPRRFGRTLEDFLQKPSGTMAVVLSKQIILTDEEKAEAARLLRRAYDKHLQSKQQTGAAVKTTSGAGVPAATPAPGE
jgi:cytochrome c2